MNEQAKVDKACRHVSYINKGLNILGYIFMGLIIAGLVGIVLLNAIGWAIRTHNYFAGQLPVLGWGTLISLIASIVVGGITSFISYLNNFDSNIIPPNYTKRMKHVRNIGLSTGTALFIVFFCATTVLYLMAIDQAAHTPVGDGTVIMTIVIAVVAIIGIALLIFWKPIMAWEPYNKYK